MGIGSRVMLGGSRKKPAREAKRWWEKEAKPEPKPEAKPEQKLEPEGKKPEELKAEGLTADLGLPVERRQTTVPKTSLKTRVVVTAVLRNHRGVKRAYELMKRVRAWVKKGGKNLLANIREFTSS